MAQYQKKKLRKSHEVFFRGPSLTYHNSRLDIITIIPARRLRFAQMAAFPRREEDKRNDDCALFHPSFLPSVRLRSRPRGTALYETLM